MKKTFLAIFTISLLTTGIFAQNPFKQFGYDVGIITLSKGKYIEFIPNDSIQQFGSMVINIKTGHIVRLINTDSVELGYNYRPDVASRWLSPDPLAEEYSSWTPYNYCMNNPIKYIDPDGRFVGDYYLNDGTHLGNDGIDDHKVYVVDNSKTNYQPATSNKPIVVFTQDAKEIKGLTSEELNVRAFLTTIRQTENGGNEPLGYNAQYGGGTFTDKSYADAPQDYADHPREVIQAWGQKSSAAGAYQFLGKFWDKDNFAPTTQDNAAVGKLDFRNATGDVMTGNIENATSKLNNEWTSLPAFKATEINALFKSNISRELNNKSIIATPVGKLLK